MARLLKPDILVGHWKVENTSPQQDAYKGISVECANS